jgi:FtsH-binding integral membrane protein
MALVGGRLTFKSCTEGSFLLEKENPMHDPERTVAHLEKRQRILRRVWLSPLATLVLPLGVWVAFALRKKNVISESSLGWVVLALPIVAVFLMGLIGFQAHEQLGQINSELSSTKESHDAQNL